MPDFTTILLEISDGIAHVALNRPVVLNAYNVQMRDDLFEVLGLIGDDPQIKVAIFRGVGDRAFCAGADLSEFGSAPSQAIARQVRFERDVWNRLLGIRKPLVAAIHGFCLGSGLEIALCCDIRMASLDAQFGLPETGLGMIPAAAGTQTLPRHSRAPQGLYHLLTGQRFSAEEARRTGLVTRLLPKEQLFVEAESLATKLASLDENTVRLGKEAFHRGLDVMLDIGLDIEWQSVTGLTLGRRGHPLPK